MFPTIKNKISYLILILSVALQLQAGEVSFDSAQIVSDEMTSSGNFFSAMKTADFDGDGDLDILISQQNLAKIFWLENNGSSLANYTKHTILNSTRFNEPKIVDLDKDGDLDFVFTDHVSDELVWVENNNNASSWTEHVIDSGAGIESITDLSLADFDKDGDLDIVIAAAVISKVYWYENSGDASSWVQNDTGHTPGGGLTCVDTGDIDNDGLPDIVYGLSGGTPKVVVLTNSAAGSTWTSSTVQSTSSSTIKSCKFEDLDLDGYAEIYTYSIGEGIEQWQQGPTSWTSTTIAIDDFGSDRVTFVDMDNDGDKDILSGSYFNTTTDFHWAENTDGEGGSGSEHLLISGITDDIDSTFAADLDGDGDVEILYTLEADGILYSHENLLFHTKPQIDDEVIITSLHNDITVVAMDFIDGDQFKDIISVGTNASGFEMYFSSSYGNGNYGLEEPVTSASSAGAHFGTMALGNLDDDNDNDIVFSMDAITSLFTVTNTYDTGPFRGTSSHFDTPVMISSSITATNKIQVLDVNYDSKDDVIVIDDAVPALKWLDNDGAWSEATISTNVTTPTDFALGDIDQDGAVDIVYASSTDASLWWSNTNADASVWTEKNSLTTDVVNHIDLIDMDNDGDLDLVASGTSSTSFFWSENSNSGGTWTKHDMGYTSDSQQIKAIDFDKDGDVDVLEVNSDGDIVLLENLGSDSWQSSILKSGLTSPFSFALVDSELDGDWDIVSTSVNTTDLIHTQNHGGQYSLDMTPVIAQTPEELETSSLMAFSVTHNGQVDDGDMQLSNLRLRVEAAGSCVGILDTTRFNSLVREVSLYLDDGSGSFEIFHDTRVVTHLPPFILSTGEMNLSLPDQGAPLQLAPAETKDYFITFKYKAGASTQTCHQLKFSLVTDSTPNTQAQDRGTNLTLTMSQTATQTTPAQTIVASTNTAPTTTGISDQEYIHQVVVSLDVSSDFNDIDGDELYYNAFGLPFNLSVDNNTGIISGTTLGVNVQDSPYAITIIVKDPQGENTSSDFQLSVLAANNPPIFTGSIADQQTTVGDAFNLDFSSSFSDSDGDPLSFSVNTIPDGLTLLPAGAIVGQATELALADSPYTITITADDGTDTANSNSFVFEVLSSNNPPVFTGPISAQEATVGDDFNLDISSYFSDADGDPLSFSVNTLPDGLTLLPAGAIVGQATELALADSPYTVTITADDGSGGGVSSNAFTFTINEDLDVIFINGFD
jgi:hypothetical protein